MDRLGLSCLFSLALLGNHSTPRQLEGCVPRGGSSGQDVKARQGFAFVALLLRKAAQVESQGWPYIKDISMLLFELREKGFRFRDLGLRRIPEGYYSEDVETFVGQLLSMGYATQRSPIRLEPEGAKLCDEILEVESGEHGAEFKRLERLSITCSQDSLPAPEHAVGRFPHLMDQGVAQLFAG